MRIRPLVLGLLALGLAAAPPAFRKAGKGPGILLIHGFGGNKEVWEGAVSDLARDHTVLAVDLPGSGGTPGPPLLEGRADFGALGRELATLVRREGLAPCLLVGHSMGGPIGAHAMLADPSAFRGLLLVDSFLTAIPEPFLEPTRLALSHEPGPALRTFFGFMAKGEAQTDRVAAEAVKIQPQALISYLNALGRDGLAGRRAQLRLPVLQLASGPRDPDPARAEAALEPFGFKELPAFRVVHFPRSRHWIMWDEPEAFLLALRAFEAGLGR